MWLQLFAFSSWLTQSLDLWNQCGCTCCHIFQHLQQHVLSFIDQFCSLYYQLPQTQVTIQDCTHQAAFEVSFDGFHLHKGREKTYKAMRYSRKWGRVFDLLALNFTWPANRAQQHKSSTMKWLVLTPIVSLWFKALIYKLNSWRKNPGLQALLLNSIQEHGEGMRKS